MRQIISVLSLSAILLLATGCTHRNAEFEDQLLIIPAKETIRVRGLDLSIKNEGFGRKWISEGQQSQERPYCGLLIRYNGLTERAGDDFRPITIGDVVIEIDRMNPWGVVEDSVPPGGCRVWIKKAIHTVK